MVLMLNLLKKVNLNFLKPEEIKVYPVTLPNGDIVWAENEEEKKILERWNKIIEQ